MMSLGESRWLPRVTWGELAMAWMSPIVPHAFPIVCFKKKAFGFGEYPAAVSLSASDFLSRWNCNFDQRYRKASWFSVQGKRSKTAETGWGTIARSSGSSPKTSTKEKSSPTPTEWMNWKMSKSREQTQREKQIIKLDFSKVIESSLLCSSHQGCFPKVATAPSKLWAKLYVIN